MLEILMVILILTALLGGYLLSYVLTDKNTPKGLAITHGAMGWIGIVILAIYSFYQPQNFISLGILILAALGGLFLFVRDILGKKIPKSVAISHGLVALGGIILLIFLA